MINGLYNANTIKMKKTALLVMTVLLSISSFAQKYGEDSVKCVQNLSLYRDYFKQKVYEDAYKYWRVVYNICPASSERMYVDGTKLISGKIKAAKTKEEKNAHIDTLLMVYDQRIKYFGNEGSVLGRKGTDMLRYRSSDIEAAFSTLNKSIELSANKSQAGAISSLMIATTKMEKAGKKTKEEVVEIFGTLSDILAFNIDQLEGKGTQKYFISAQESVEKTASPYLSCEVLEEMAAKNYEKNKSDNAWMERTANILDKKGCTEAEIFFTIAKELHSTNPSAVSAEKMGIMSLKTKNYSQAESYFLQAIELAEGEEKKYDYYIELATAQSTMGAYSKARSSARKAAEMDNTKGLPYIMIGDMISGSSSACPNSDACLSKAIYWLAIDYYSKAKSVEPAIASKANAKIASFKKYFPEKSDCFFKNIKEGDAVEIGCWIGESTKARFN